MIPAPAALERWPELVKLLGRRGWTAAEINDWLWLARTLAADLPQTPADRRSEEVPPPGGGEGDPANANHGGAEPEADQRPAGPAVAPPPPDPPTPPTPPAPPEALLAPLTAENAGDAAAPRVGIADSALIRRPRQLGRALAPLSRWQEEGPACLLDVEATVEAIATARSDGMPWQPCLRPRRQPWLQLQLVFDGSPSMALWQRLRRELPRLLAREVRWRDLRCWQLLNGPRGTVALHDLRGRPCAPRRLRQRSDRSLVLVVSDAVGPAWYQGAMAELLQGWALVQPVALLQLFPQRLWLRTALAEQPAGWIRSATPMRPHGQLAWQPVEGGPPEAARAGAAPWLTLPVLQLQPEFLGGWARLLAGSRQGSALAYRFALPQPVSSHGVASAAGADAAAADTAAADTEDLLAVFLFTASARARKLLALLTFAPLITLPIVRLLQGQMLDPMGAEPVVEQAVVEQAEVLLSGLFVPASPPPATPIPIDQQLLRFADEGLRPRLREGLRVWQARAVYERVQAFVIQRLNLSQDQFEALLLTPEQCDSHPDQELLRAFATAAPSCLRGLGGRYEALAEQLERRSRPEPPDTPPPPPPAPADASSWLQGLEERQETFETAQLVDTPALEVVTVSIARWQELPLQPISFPTLGPADLGSFLRQVERDGGEAARASLPRATAWAFYEPLRREGFPFGATAERPDPLALTLVEIPAGRFLMGSPAGEDARSASEGPQHAVTLASFFISQTPITQAQWREVALWQPGQGETWGRELDPKPSYFRGRNPKARGFSEERFSLLPGETSSDLRPVENVSWDDAMEFCNRLSQRTGRLYMLPSEAQWEYACRARTDTPFSFGATLTTELINCATYSTGSKGVYRKQTTPVGMFPANARGLYDMHGNVREWCLDHWHSRYQGAPTDGSAWLNAVAQHSQPRTQKRIDGTYDSKMKVLRGGSWFNLPSGCRSACRSRDRPDYRDIDVGFRVCCLPQD